MAVSEKRVLRLKTTMMFSGQLTMTPGDYEGDLIPPELEAEFEAGSRHVEEIVTRLPGAEKKPQKRGKGPSTQTGADSLGSSIATGGPSDEVEKVDINMDSLKGDAVEVKKAEDLKTETQKGGEYDDLEALAAEEQMAKQIDIEKDKF